MQRIETLRRRIKSGEDLQSVVRTMKVLTAAGIQQFEHAAASLGEYFRTIEMGLQIVLPQSYEADRIYLSENDRQVGVLVIGSGQGLCGSFDETIVRFVVEHIEEHGIMTPRVIVLGERASGYMEQEWVTVDRTLVLPGTVAGISDVVSQLLMKLELWQTQQMTSILVFHNKPAAHTRFVPRVQHLLPLDSHWLKRLAERHWATNNLPQFTMEPSDMFSILIRQYLYVSLYRAVAESLAAEHASRLNSMQAAEQKIEDWLTKLHSAYRQERHAAINEELLDIMAGFELVRSGANTV